MTEVTTYSADEVAKHNEAGDCWVIIDDDVYDLTRFAMLHPGGLPPLKDSAGTDATDVFYGMHRAEILKEKKYARFKIGKVAGAAGKSFEMADLTPEQEEMPAPYGEAMGFWRKFSNYYTESHHDFRAALRGFIDTHIRPDAAQWDEDGERPSLELNQLMGQTGVLAAVVGSHGQILRDFGIEMIGGVDYDDFDEFHELIVAEEFKRLGCYGLTDGLHGALSIGVPPIMYFGTPEQKHRIARPVLLGDKRIALAISEPYAGSDVAQTRCSAVMSADGTHWIVTGVKKWITGGMMADYFTTLVNTPSGKTMMVIERDDETVETRPIKTSYSAAAGTAYVIFDEAKVPLDNVLGEEGNGFAYTMKNFNKERWGMVAAGNRMSRLMVSECFKWAMQRQVFGQRLIDQPVIRLKLAEMAAEVESVHSFLEDVTHQMKQIRLREGADAVNSILAGPIAMLKYKQTRVATLVSDHACQIFGGRAITRTGMGQFVEKFQRSFKMQAILGGSEEIMADFSIRQAMKKAGTNMAKL